MNEIIKAMEERRSIRKFQPTMPTKDDLAQIVEAGLYAASGMGRQSAIIIAVTNKELRDELAKTNAEIMGKPDFDPFYGAPAILIVLADKSCRTAIYDGSLVMGNLMLAACWCWGWAAKIPAPPSSRSTWATTTSRACVFSSASRWKMSLPKR